MKPIVILTTNLTFSTPDSPFTVSSGMDRTCECDGKYPFQKNGMANENWVVMDLKGWCENIREVVILNLEGNFPNRNPTPKELEETMKKVLVVGVADVNNHITPFTKIYPRGHLVLNYHEGIRYFIRSEVPFTKYKFVTMPE